VEDVKRHNSDKRTNLRRAEVVGKGEAEWRDVAVGDLVVIKDKEEIPADVVLLTSSEDEGVGFVETANIDGETNLKIKKPVRDGNNNLLGERVEDLTRFTYSYPSTQILLLIVV